MTTSKISLMDASRAYWERATPKPIDTMGVATRNYLQCLRDSYSNGTVIGKWFQMLDTEPVGEFSFEQVFEYLMKDRLFRKHEVAGVFGDYEIPIDTKLDAVLNGCHGYHLPRHLAVALQVGGAYTPVRSDTRFYDLALATSLELSDGDLNRISVWFGTEAWCSFFLDVAWDHTLIVRRAADNKVFIMMATDTD